MEKENITMRQEIMNKYQIACCDGCHYVGLHCDALEMYACLNHFLEVLLKKYCDEDKE